MAVVSSIVAGTVAAGSAIAGAAGTIGGAVATGISALGAGSGLAGAIGSGVAYTGASAGVSTLAGYAGAAAIYGGLAYGAYGAMTPDIPGAPKPPAEVQKGTEGIRRGDLQRESKKRELGALYLTRGSRADDATLGGYTKSLGG